MLEAEKEDKYSRVINKEFGKVTDSDGGIDTLNIAFLNENLHGFETKRLHLRFFQGLAFLELLYLLV